MECMSVDKSVHICTQQVLTGDITCFSRQHCAHLLPTQVINRRWSCCVSVGATPLCISMIWTSSKGESQNASAEWENEWGRVTVVCTQRQPFCSAHLLLSPYSGNLLLFIIFTLSLFIIITLFCSSLVIYHYHPIVIHHYHPILLISCYHSISNQWKRVIVPRADELDVLWFCFCIQCSSCE